MVSRPQISLHCWPSATRRPKRGAEIYQREPRFPQKNQVFLFILDPTISPVLDLSYLAKRNYVTTLGQLDSFRPASAWPSAHGYVRL